MILFCLQILCLALKYFYFSISLTSFCVVYQFSFCICPEEKVTERKNKNTEKSNPNDDQLRKATCVILKELDFNTVTSFIIFESCLIPSSITGGIYRTRFALLLC